MPPAVRSFPYQKVDMSFLTCASVLVSGVNKWGHNTDDQACTSVDSERTENGPSPCNMHNFFCLFIYIFSSFLGLA